MATGKEVGGALGGTSVIEDNQAESLLVISEDLKEYIEIDTSDSAPLVILAKDGAKVGVGDPSPDALLSIKASATSGDWLHVDASNGEKALIVGTANTDDGQLTVNKDGIAQHKFLGNSGVVLNEQGLAGNDFRVESDSNTHMLFVDGGANAIGINQDSIDAPLHVVGVGGDTGMSWATGDNSPTMIIENSSGSSKDRCLLALNADGASGSSVDLYQGDNRRMNLGGTASGAYVYGDGVPLNISASGTNAIACGSKVVITSPINTSLTGTFTATNGSTAISSGSSTAFLTELAVGATIKIGSETFTVAAIASDVALTLDSAFAGSTASGLSGTRNPATSFEVLTGDSKPMLKLDRIGQLTLGDTATFGNILITDGDIVTSTAVDNVIIGTETRTTVTTSESVLIGKRAAKGTDVTKVTAIGAWAGEEGLGTETVCVGYQAGIAGAGNYSTALGSQSLRVSTMAGGGSNGQHNVSIGYNSGSSMVAAYDSIMIGSGANGHASYANQVAIGRSATTDAANQVRLGNTSVTDIDGEVALTATSDSRVKTNIEDLAAGLEFINALRPVSFSRVHPADWPEEIRDKRYREGQTSVDGDGNESTISTSYFDVETQQPIKDTFDDAKRSDGLLAQEVQAACKNLGVTFNGISERSDGKLGIQYSLLVAPLIKAVQELTARIEVLENGE